MLSYGRFDGILISGKTTSTLIDNQLFSHAAEGDIFLETNIDIVSRTYETPGRTFGSMFWLIGGLIIEAIFIYNFEKGTLKKIKGTSHSEEREIRLAQDNYNRRLDIYLPPKEQ